MGYSGWRRSVGINSYINTVVITVFWFCFKTVKFNRCSIAKIQKCLQIGAQMFGLVVFPSESKIQRFYTLLKIQHNFTVNLVRWTHTNQTLSSHTVGTVDHKPSNKRKQCKVRIIVMIKSGCGAVEYFSAMQRLTPRKDTISPAMY